MPKCKRPPTCSVVTHVYVQKCPKLRWHTDVVSGRVGTTASMVRQGGRYCQHHDPAWGLTAGQGSMFQLIKALRRCRARRLMAAAGPQEVAERGMQPASAQLGLHYPPNAALCSVPSICRLRPPRVASGLLMSSPACSCPRVACAMLQHVAPGLLMSPCCTRHAPAVTQHRVHCPGCCHCCRRAARARVRQRTPRGRGM